MVFLTKKRGKVRLCMKKIPAGNAGILCMKAQEF